TPTRSSWRRPAARDSRVSSSAASRRRSSATRGSRFSPCGRRASAALSDPNLRPARFPELRLSVVGRRAGGLRPSPAPRLSSPKPSPEILRVEVEDGADVLERVEVIRGPILDPFLGLAEEIPCLALAASVLEIDPHRVLEHRDHEAPLGV